eukprot:Nk52_evm10s2485 gene=Nk52_evmTU10s2485
MLDSYLRSAVGLDDSSPVQVRRLVVWCAHVYFWLMVSYYIMQPVRDEMIGEIGVEYLTLLFNISLVTMLVVNSILTSFTQSGRNLGMIVPLVYRTFAVSMVVFCVLFSHRKYALANDQSVVLEVNSEERSGNPVWDGEQKGSSGGLWRNIHLLTPFVFYVYVGVVILTVTSLFWTFLTDVFEPTEAAKYFGLIGAGGTFGQIVGSFLTVYLTGFISSKNLLLLSGMGLFVTSLFMKRLAYEAMKLKALALHPSRETKGVTSCDKLFKGFYLIGQSRFLIGICCWVFIFNFSSSYLYLMKTVITTKSIGDSIERTSFLAKNNALVGLSTLGLQLVGTGRLMTFCGLKVTLAITPLISLSATVLLYLYPHLGIVLACEVLRKISNHGLAKPSREALFTVVSKEEKISAKNLIDMFIHRLADSFAANAFSIAHYFNDTFAMTVFVVLCNLVWVAISLYLGGIFKVISVNYVVASSKTHSHKT